VFESGWLGERLANRSEVMTEARTQPEFDERRPSRRPARGRHDRRGEDSQLIRMMADSGVLWVLLLVVIGVGYFLPTLIGAIRGVDKLALVFLVNLIGTPMLIGWPAALILAFGPRRLPPEPMWPLHPGLTYRSPDAWRKEYWDAR
jgi:hypothetical protein